MDYIGDYKNGATVNIFFTTNQGNGAAVAPLSAYEAGDIKIYKNSSNAEKTTANGVTMTSPFDTITGLHNIVLDTSNNTGDAAFWAAGNDYTVVLSADTETVDGQSVVKALSQFSIENRCVNWAQVGSPTTTVGLTNTTISSSQVVASVTAGVTLAASAVQAIWDALTSALTTVGSIGKLLVTNIDAAISSRIATSGYTAPDNTSIAAIKVQTDKMGFTVPNQLDANIQYVNDVQVKGSGTSVDPWNPA